LARLLSTVEQQLIESHAKAIVERGTPPLAV
jgi:hypothetical protein